MHEMWKTQQACEHFTIVSVSLRSPLGAPDDRGAGNVLAETSKFGFTPDSCAVRHSLLGVRRADRNVEGGVRVAEGRGEDVGGPEVSARDEAGNLRLGSAALWPRVASPKAQQVACAAPVSKDLEVGKFPPARPRQHSQVLKGACGFTEALRLKYLRARWQLTGLAS